MFVQSVAGWAKRQRVFTWLYLGGALLLVGAGLLWWFKVQVNPERVFWGMLGQSLSTNGVAVESSQENGGASVDYKMHYSLGGEPRAHSLTTVTQSGSKVTTEMIGTLKANYTRYLNIETTQKDKAGKPLDVSSIEGAWAKTEDNGAVLSQGALGLNIPLGAMPVPIANLSPAKREALLQHMRDENVYEVDFGKTKSKRVDGRLQYVYKAKIQVILYANLMKQFGKSVGLHDLDQLDPNSYSGAPPIEVEMTVDVRSRHLVGVHVVTQQGNYDQKFSGYDVPVGVEIPKQTISSQELQQRLQELQ